MLKVLAKAVSHKIYNNVRKTGVYSILSDETKDCSKKEQLCLIVRYVDVDSATIFEHFFSYTKLTSLNIERLSSREFVKQ